MDRVVWVGPNDLRAEIEEVATTYKTGLFIEALPESYERLFKTTQECNKKHGTDFSAINALVSNDNNEHTFHVFNNEGHTSSMFPANPKCWGWPSVQEVGSVQLQAHKLKDILRTLHYTDEVFDLVVDVQGAELQVLLSMGPYLNNVCQITTEVSKHEFHVGGVLFHDLDMWLNTHGFTRRADFQDIKNVPVHGDIVYVRNSIWTM